MCSICEESSTDRYGDQQKIIRRELTSIYNLLDSNDHDSLLMPRAQFEELAERKTKAGIKGLVKIDEIENWVRCYKCNQVLFPLRTNCEGCVHFARLLDLDRKTPSGDSSQIHELAQVEERKYISRRFCTPCAIGRFQMDPQGRTIALSRFF